MIFTDRTISVRKGESRMDEPIVVYRGDYELEIRFTILNSKLKFMSGTNIIESEKASYGQLAILTPHGGNIFSDIVRCNDGSVTFVLTAEMLNQIDEVGLYSFQIRLMDYNKESRVSIPPIEFGIEVREPIASEDHDNSVNDAIVGYSIAKVVNPSEEKNVDTFDENGNYNKTKWETGDRISEVKLNKIEDAIDTINNNEIINNGIIDKRIISNFNVLSSEMEQMNAQLNADIDKKADIIDVDSKINALSSGGPKGVFSTVSDLENALPSGDSAIYVVSADGCWYYWKDAWVKGGVYQDTKIADGSVGFGNLSNTVQVLASHIVSESYLPTNEDVIIDVDTERKVIRINCKQSAGPAYNANTLQKTYRTTMNVETSDVDGDGWVELDYSDITSSALIICYDLVYNIFRLRRWDSVLEENEIRFAIVRTSVATQTPYGNTHLITYNGGNPGRQMQSQIDLGLTKSKWFTKTIWLSKYARGEYIDEKMIVDIENHTIKIPANEYVYGKTNVIITESYTITFSPDTSLVYILYNLDTGLFEARGFSELNDADVWYKNKYLVYDVFRTHQHVSIFTDELIFLRKGDIDYLNLKDIADFTKFRPFYMLYNPKYGPAYRFHIIDKNNLMRISYKQTGLSSTNHKRLGLESRRPNSANLVKINKDDKLDAIRLYNPYTDFEFAVLGIAISADGSSTKTVFDSGWILNTDMIVGTPANNYTNGKHIEKDSIFEKASELMGYDVESIFLVSTAHKKDDAAILDLDEVKDLKFIVEPVYHTRKFINGGDLSNRVINDDITTVRVGRSRYVIPKSLDGYDNIHVRLNNPYITIDNETFKLQISIHYLNENGACTLDTNWFKSINESDNLECEASIVRNWTRRYNAKKSDNIGDIIRNTKNAEIYIGCDGTGLTEDKWENIIKSINIEYQINKMDETEYIEFELDNNLKRMLLENIQTSSSTSSTSNNNLSLLQTPTSYTSSTVVGRIDIPKEARGFIVEFRGGVTDGQGSVTFANSNLKITIENKGLKSFKMRFNKSDLSRLTGDITVTPADNSKITIQGLKVIPVFGEVPTSNHNKAQFYLHRGYSAAYPENSLLAVEEACKRGCTIIEIDTFSSTDNKTLVLHDESLGRTNHDRPTITFNDPTLFSYNNANSFYVDSSIIDEFEINDYISIYDNDTKKNTVVKNISDRLITIDSNLATITGPINSIDNNRRYVKSCSLTEFLEYEIGAHKNGAFAGEYNAPFEEYIKVVSRYDAALLLDIRTMNEQHFKGEIAELLDKYNYWDRCYFMHSLVSIARYNKWAKDIDRKIVCAPILWTSGQNLYNDIETYGNTTYDNISRKDVVIQSKEATREIIDLAHSYGMRVYVFTVNTIEEAQRVFRMGVDVVGGDYFSDDKAILW